MKKIFINFILSFSFLFSNSLNLTQNDIVILKKLKSLTDDKMMKYSLMAIAIKESSLGKYVINSKSEDYGLFQANIKTVLSRQKVKDNSYNRSIYAQKLINDVGFATANAIIELKYWKKVHKDNWFKTWSSYNTGWNYNSKTGIKYSEKVFELIKKLKLEYKL
ncbi:hypothetical protein LPB137_13340 [Poseidonibacter parvus]|uniref:Transglycosylase SLT domain-containing protein n=1 Tax=Poseidonibacter parvus TaxID=1850254 RepID=A0A1P8KQ80_9BACT|nr:transglycosylase SLT domain-containing protein [Poseidonibacter parvus]APW66772.1 hypothetical protein LPB137_13340 [Poseidonibacter parvus]